MRSGLAAVSRYFLLKNCHPRSRTLSVYTFVRSRVTTCTHIYIYFFRLSNCHRVYLDRIWYRFPFFVFFIFTAYVCFLHMHFRWARYIIFYSFLFLFYFKKCSENTVEIVIFVFKFDSSGGCTITQEIFIFKLMRRNLYYVHLYKKRAFYSTIFQLNFQLKIRRIVSHKQL